MRYIELITYQRTCEGRSWTDDDDVKLLQDQIKREDNIRAFYLYVKDVHLTNAVKLLAQRPDCKWFFDFLVSNLHFMDAVGIYPLTFYMRKNGSDLHIWARDDSGKNYRCLVKSNATFPLDAIRLRAVYEGNFWHVSFGRNS